MSGESELLRGTIKTWDDAKGYGFIEPHEKGKDVFFHIKQWTLRDERPTLGRQVFYIQEEASRGKVRASLVRPLASIKQPTVSSGFQAMLSSRLGYPLILLSVGLISGLLWITKQPWEIPLVYLVMSKWTFRVYSEDKALAGKGYRRVPERALHLLSLFCGWPGAFIAQKRFRHKTVKADFQLAFWVTVIGNIGLAIGYLFLRWQIAPIFN